MLAFISSNKWFKAGYGGKLRQYIADTCDIHSITDFGELPVFKSAAVLTMIFVSQVKAKNHDVNEEPRSPKFTEVKSLLAPYPDVKALIEASGSFLPYDAIDGANWLLTDRASADKIRQMNSVSIPLSEYVKGQIYRGVVTGFNKAFVIDRDTRDLLVKQNSSSTEVIKPLVVGDDIRKWNIRDKSRYLISMYHGIDTSKIDNIITYLKPFRQQLEQRATKQEWYELQQPQMRYRAAFNQPKIIYPDICQTSRFTFDNKRVFTKDTAFIIPTDDMYLLGVLNSIHVWNYLEDACPEILGQSLRLKNIYMNKLPIPQASEIEQKAISKLVQKCLDAKGVGCEAWEREIDEIVAGLYGFASETPPLDAKTLGFGKGIQHEPEVAVLTSKTRKSKQPANTSASIESDLN